MIDFADVPAYLNENRGRLLQLMARSECTPSAVEVVDLPKDRINVRPLARLDLESRLVYEATTFAVAPFVQHLLPRRVYSYRWWDKEERLLAPTRSWIDLQHHGRRYSIRNPALALARTDITAFYENIDVEIMRDELQEVGSPVWASQTRGVFLEAFNGLSNVWGIPQGYDASGVLANLYLLPLDREIELLRFFHLRYSDDTYVFGRDWSELRELIVALTRTLRNRHLIPSGAKTSIIDPENVLAEFEDIEKDAISYGLRNFISDTEEDLRAVFDRAVDREQPNVRDIRFCLTKFKELEDDYAAEWLMANLSLIPHAVREAMAYLFALKEKIGVAERRIAHILASQSLVAYPYAEQHLLIFLIQTGHFSGEAIAAAWSMLLNKNRESFLREMASRYLGQHLRTGSAARLKQELQHDPHPGVRRALLVAAYESRQLNERNLSVFSASDGPQRATARYLLSSPSPRIPLPRMERPPWRTR